MEWITAMQQAITYMEEHLLEDVNYEDVAKQVYISNYEFHRAFSFLTGMTANSYIRSRRLSLAAREIVETDASITEIALKYGYDTPEGFTKAFTRFHGIAPKFARDGAAKLKLFNPLLTLRYSATPKEMYNLIYRLDAMDAYNKKLVKKMVKKKVVDWQANEALKQWGFRFEQLHGELPLERLTDHVYELCELSAQEAEAADEQLADGREAVGAHEPPGRDDARLIGEVRGETDEQERARAEQHAERELRGHGEVPVLRAEMRIHPGENRAREHNPERIQRLEHLSVTDGDAEDGMFDIFNRKEVQ